MKINSFLRVLIALGLGVLCIGAASAAANIVAYYSFDNTEGNATGTASLNASGGSVGWGYISNSSCKQGSCAIMNANATNVSINLTGMPLSTNYAINWWSYESNTVQNSNIWAQVNNTGVIGARAEYSAFGLNDNSISYETGSTVWTQVNANVPNIHMWTYMENSTNSTIFKDGALDNGTTIGKRLGSGNFTVGQNGINTNNRLIGIIDEMSFINRNLSTTEISCLYNGGSGSSYIQTLACLQSSNFSVSASDQYNGSTILSFNASINGTFFSTTTGSINTTVNMSAVNGTINVIVNATNYFSNSSNVNANTSYGASIIPFTAIRASATGFATINNFTINYLSTTNASDTGTVTTTNGIAYIPLYNSIYTLNLTNANHLGTNFAASNTTITTNPYNQSYNFSLYLSNTVNIRIYYEINQTLLNSTTVTVAFSGTIAGYNYSTTNGTINASLLTPDTYLIIVSAVGFNSRQYQLQLNNQTVNSLNFYLLQAGNSTLTISDVDKSYQAIVGYQNSLLRLNSSSTNYFEVERCIGDVNGQCLVSAQLCTATSSDCPFYRVIVYDTTGALVGDSGGQKISSNTLTLVINNQNPLQGVINFFGRSQYLSAINTTTGVVYYYLDNTQNIASQIQLVMQRRIGTSFLTLETVTSTSTGSVALNTSGANLSLGEEFIATGYYTDSQGIVHLGDRKTYSPASAGLGSTKGSVASFVGIGIVLAPLLLFGMSPPIAIFGAIIMLFMVNGIGLMSLTTNAIGGVAVLGAIVLWLGFTR